MSDRKLAFSTFLKLLELQEHQKATTLRGFLRGGGFNYWRPLQILAPEIVRNELDLIGIQTKMATLAKGHQRKYNDQALTKLLKWVSGRNLVHRRVPHEVVIKFGNSGLSVRLNPEIAFALEGRKYLMHIWATNNPVLSDETLSMGLNFFRKHSQSTANSDTQFLIFDAVKDRVFTEINILGNAEEMLSVQRKLLNKLWADIDTSDKIPAPKPSIGDYFPDQPGSNFL